MALSFLSFTIATRDKYGSFVCSLPLKDTDNSRLKLWTTMLSVFAYPIRVINNSNIFVFCLKCFLFLRGVILNYINRRTPDGQADKDLSSRYYCKHFVLVAGYVHVSKC
jgi:hypothetical protein